MQRSPVQIGSISLQDFEVPPVVSFGGRHRLAVYTTANGGRLVERLGPDDSEIYFQGTFAGQNAESRARALDTLRRSGAVVWLTWNSFRRRVVVHSFQGIYSSPWWIGFRLGCTVVEHESLSFQNSVTLQLSSSMSLATSAAVGAGLSLIALQNALNASNACTPGTYDQAQAIAAAKSAMQSASGVAADTSISLTDFQFETRPVRAIPEALASTTVIAGTLASAVNVRSHVGSILSTLTRFGT